MTNRLSFRGVAILALAALAFVLAGCESMNVSSLGKRIDYQSASSSPPLELPPDLTTPQYDDRYAVTSASELAARNSARPQRTELLPTNPDAAVSDLSVALSEVNLVDYDFQAAGEARTRLTQRFEDEVAAAPAE